MSLTSVLDDRKSKVRALFEERFPNTREIVRETNALLRRAETIRPNGTVPFATLGTAFDYRMRYHFAVTPSEELAAWKGARRVSEGDDWIPVGENAWYRAESPLGTPSLSEETVENFFRDLDKTLANIQPPGQLLPPNQEESLLRYCVVLALFEETYRARVRRDSLLFSIGKNPTTEELLSLVKTDWIDDLRILTQGMAKNFAAGKYSKVVLNPTFSGSLDVGGADADMILDGCLLEIKSTVKASIEKLHVYQLLGYILLDYDNEHELEKAGFYMARQCQLVTWPINDLIGRLMVKTPPPLEELRLELREAAISSKS